MLRRLLQHPAHGVVIVFVICQAASGISGGLTDSINSNCVEYNSQEGAEQESCSIQAELQAETIHKMPKAREIKQIATAHMQREG